MGKWSYWLLLLPIIAMLAVPSYNTLSPALVGVPFFYWYQFLWVILTGIVTALVFALTGGEG